MGSLSLTGFFVAGTVWSLIFFPLGFDHKSKHSLNIQTKEVIILSSAFFS